MPWVDEIRYLGVSLSRSRLFKCSFDAAKRAFYRSLNAIFGRVGRVASEEVTLQLVASKCLPVLLYDDEACPLNKSDINSFDFAVNRFMMKLFKTTNKDTIADCRSYLNVSLPSSLILTRTSKFIVKYKSVNSVLSKLFSS